VVERLSRHRLVERLRVENDGRGNASVLTPGALKVAGHRMLYYKNAEGGQARASNHRQVAYGR